MISSYMHLLWNCVFPLVFSKQSTTTRLASQLGSSYFPFQSATCLSFLGELASLYSSNFYIDLIVGFNFKRSACQLICASYIDHYQRIVSQQYCLLVKTSQLATSQWLYFYIQKMNNVRTYMWPHLIVISRLHQDHRLLFNIANKSCSLVVNDQLPISENECMRSMVLALLSCMQSLASLFMSWSIEFFMSQQLIESKIFLYQIKGLTVGLIVTPYMVVTCQSHAIVRTGNGIVVYFE